VQKKRFLKLPEYPGGKEEFRKYILENLKYPEEALKKRIEGTVHLSADINDNGEVLDVQIVKGIGYGCDEEAARLVSGCHFGGVKNQGVRLKTRKKFRIRFELIPQQKITNQETQVVYNFSPSTKGSEPVKTWDVPDTTPATYSYTVTVSNG
jgi:TonB family protein